MEIRRLKMPPKKNYSKMYDKKEEPAVMTEVTPDEVIETTVEDIIKEDKKDSFKTGKVVGEANLNVRQTPGGSVVTTITPGTEVEIETEVNEDWYKITKPVTGHVMKKFIEVG